MADQKKKKNVFQIVLGGKKHDVVQGDMTDEQYAASYNDALKNGLTPDAEQYKAAKEKESEGVVEARPQSGNDFMELDTPDVGGAKKRVKVYRGPAMDDAEWSKHVERARASGSLINSVESVPPPSMRTVQNAKQEEVRIPVNGDSPELRDATNGAVKKLSGPVQTEPEGNGGGKYSQIKKFADDLFKGAVPASQISVEDVHNGYGESPGAAPPAAKISVTDLENGYGKNKPRPQAPAAKTRPLVKGSNFVVPTERVMPEMDLTRTENMPEMDLTGEQRMPEMDIRPETVAKETETVYGKPRSNPSTTPSGSMLSEIIPGAGDPSVMGSGSTSPGAPDPKTAQWDKVLNTTGQVYDPARQARNAMQNATGGAAGGALAAATMPASPVPAGSMGGSAKVSSSGGPPASPMPVMPDREGQINAAYDAKDAATQKLVDTQAAGFDEQARLQNDEHAAAIGRRATELRDQEDVDNHIAAGQAAVAKTINEMSEPAKLDPDRWWNSRSTVQKVFAVLSAGLTKGATLSMFQHAIDRDVEAQQGDITNKKNFQQAKLSGQMNIVQMARENKLDLYEAQKVAKAYHWDQIERATKSAVANSSSAVAKANGAEMITIAGIQRQKELGDIDRHRQMLALEGKKIEMQDRHNKSMEGAAWTRANAAKSAPAKSGLQPVRGAMAMELNGMKDALDAAKGYSKEFKEKASSFVSKLTALDPTGTTDAAKYDAKRMLIVKSMARAIEGYRVTDADMVQYEKMIPQAGAMKGNVQWDSIVNRIEEKLRNNLKGAQAQKFDTGSMDSFAGGGAPADGGDNGDDAVGEALGFEGY